MRFKKTVFVFFMLNGIFGSIHSQQLADSALYNPGISMIRNSRTATDFKQAAAYFEDLSENNPSHWLSLYYAALCYIQASHKLQEDKERDAMLDKAQPLLDKAGKKKSKEPEILVLQAFLYQSRIQVNPQLRGMSYSSKAESSLKKATEADDSNPRAWSLLGYNLYYTPALFGGGPEKALPYFEKARDKFINFKPLMPFYPTWGKSENQQMIADCRNAVKSPK
jgi:tetratricopeptide (TPR) repeat protein